MSVLQYIKEGLSNTITLSDVYDGDLPAEINTPSKGSNVEFMEAKNNYFYHVTHKKNVRSIMKNGILPKINRDMNDIKAVFLFDNMNTLEDAMMNWLGDKFDEDDELVVLTIDKKQLKNIQYDKDVGYEYYTKEIIKPSAILKVENMDDIL